MISISNWIIFQYRVVASGFSWNVSYDDYKDGFGSSDSENFWMGLERLHILTTSGNYRLRLEWQEPITHYWFSTEYWIFYIDDEAAKWQLHVTGYVHGDDGRAMYVLNSFHVTCTKTFAINTEQEGKENTETEGHKMGE